MERRTFLGWFSVGLVASSLPVALAACAQPDKKLESLASGTNVLANTPRSDGFIAAGTVAQLNKEGQIFNEKSPVGALLVVRTNANTISAVDPTCTHKGCIVKWRATQKDFICPCHDAIFAADGKAIEKPAKTPLATYEAKIEGDLVLVKAKGQRIGDRSGVSDRVQSNSSRNDDDDDSDGIERKHKEPD
jgi:cytochrome b6-f complex iron-sulfur subunit